MIKWFDKCSNQHIKVSPSPLSGINNNRNTNSARSKILKIYYVFQ